MSFVYITEENAKLQKKGGRYLVGRNLEIVLEIPEETLEGLVLIGNIQVTADAVTSLLRQGIPVTWLSHTGRFFGRLESTNHVDVFRQQKQVLMQGSQTFFNLSKKIVSAKVHNQLIVLKRYNRRYQDTAIDQCINSINVMSKLIPGTKDIESLMGYEGRIAKEYFKAVGALMPEGFEFSTRTRRPPLDPFNSLISFGYTLLMYEFYTAITNHGLSPYFGFMHKLKNHHPALASDLMEEWRPVLIDSLVIGLIHHHELLPEHFYTNENKPGLYLTRDGRNKFIRAYEKRLKSMNRYLDENMSYRKAIDYQTGKFSQALMAEDDNIYESVKLR